jgi:hypothetical protein
MKIAKLDSINLWKHNSIIALKQILIFKFKIMKANYSLLIISLFIFSSLTVFSQNDNINYKHSRITLSTGELIRAKNISLNSDSVLFAVYNSAAGKNMNVSYELNRIQKIEVATKNNFLFGLIIGTGVGVIAMLIVEKKIEEPKTKTTTTSGPGGTQTQTTTTVKTMDPPGKLLIITGGSLLGTLIGASIKKGWKTVFPQSTSILDKFDFNLSLNPIYGNTSGLTLSYKF